ncbi:hypothetical protein HNY73_003038 [Argiope bruennichi]|uniref:SAP domain-containing protein n=1 Tax=Argiope bruennichi TaxID=94029 RepID=A0A8T0FY80_ARGBR|nr:hypothetical protein HNY73_003038 [Argiope bruennichi]
MLARNLPTSGLKDDLIERLREALEREQSSGGISDNVGETNEQSKKAAEEKQKEESALEDKLTQLLSFMTEMKAGQVEMKTEMKAGQAEMKSEMKEINNAVKVANAKVEEFEGRLEEMEKKFEKLKQEMEVQVTEESRESYETPQEFGLAAANQSQNARYMPVVNRPCMKLLPYDGQTSWQVYKTQFAIVAEANGWDPITKARQLASSLRAEAADILRTIPDNEQLNFDALSSALELRFGEICLKDYSRLQLKTRQQKPNETLQELATDIEKLSHLAFSDCPTEVRETLAVQCVALFQLGAVEREPCHRITCKSDITIPARIEMLVRGAAEKSQNFRHGLTEFPDSENFPKGVLVASALVDLSKETVPVRVVNLTGNPKTIRKGDVLATCAPVTCIQKHPEIMSKKPSKELELNLLKPTELNEEQKSVAWMLIDEYENCFPVHLVTSGERNWLNIELKLGITLLLNRIPEDYQLLRQQKLKIY